MVADLASELEAPAETPSGASAGDLKLVAALRRGDESAFAELLDTYQASLLRLARVYVTAPGAAQEVVQDTWVGILRGIDRFEARSTLKTWIYSILMNCAKTSARREGRSVPFSSLWNSETEPGEPSVEPERFLPADDPRWPHHWTSFPSDWNEIPEKRLLAQETLAMARRAMEALPASQREVIMFRDVEGWSSEEVCNVLGLSETNQRVLLHRARSKVRRALERYFEGAQAASCLILS